MAKKPNADPPDPRRRRQAILRLILGQLQIVGATATLVLLLQTGTSRLTLSVAAASAALTLFSMILFKTNWKRH